MKVICPKCGNPDEVVRISLDYDPECECSGCSETYTVDEALEIVAGQLAAWQAIARWIATNPLSGRSPGPACGSGGSEV